MRRLPEGWARVRMHDVVRINPRKIKPDLEDRTLLVFVPMRRVAEDFGGIDVSGRRHFSSIKRGYTQFRPGDVLFAKITPCMENGKIAIVPEIRPPVGYGSTEFFVMRPRIDGIGRWITYCVARSSFRRLARDSMQGAVGQRRVPKVWLGRRPRPPRPPPRTASDRRQDRVAVRQAGRGRRSAEACRGESGALPGVRPQGGGRGEADRAVEERESARGDRRGTASAHPGRTAQAVGDRAARQVRG